jgi:hypothetical protein
LDEVLHFALKSEIGELDGNEFVAARRKKNGFKGEQTIRGRRIDLRAHDRRDCALPTWRRNKRAATSSGAFELGWVFFFLVPDKRNTVGHRREPHQ